MKGIHHAFLIFLLAPFFSCSPEQPISLVLEQDLLKLPHWNGGCWESNEKLLVEQNEFKSWWISHNVSLGAPVPAIDFKKYAIVVICLGVFPHSGYELGIDRIETYQDKTVIQYREVFPPKNGKYAAIVYSLGIVQVIPRPEKMPVLFKKVLIQKPDFPN